MTKETRINLKIVIFWVSAPRSKVDIYQTARRNNPIDDHIYNRRLENLEYHNINLSYVLI